MATYDSPAAFATAGETADSAPISAIRVALRRQRSIRDPCLAFEDRRLLTSFIFSLPSLGDTRRTCAKVGPEPALGRRIGSWPVFPGHVWPSLPTCANLRKRALREKRAPIDGCRKPRSTHEESAPLLSGARTG